MEEKIKVLEKHREESEQILRDREDLMSRLEILIEGIFVKLVRLVIGLRFAYLLCWPL